MNVFVKFEGQNGYTDTYLKGFKADGEIATTENVDEAINLCNNYWSYETITNRCKFLETWFNPKAFITKFFDKCRYIKVGKKYVKVCYMKDGNTHIVLTPNKDGAASFSDDEVIAHIKEELPCAEIENETKYMTIKEIGEKA